MAELILTEAEKEAATWLELDDATLGKLVKKQALAITAKSDDMERVTTLSAAMLLCGYAVEASAETATHNLRGFTKAGAEFGDWQVTVEKLPDTQGQPD